MEVVALTLPHLPAQDAPSSSTSHASTRTNRDRWLRPQKIDRADRAESSSVTGVPARALAVWHLASLDAPTVAAVWTLSFAWAAGVRLAAWIPPLFVLTVWAVYVFDRLLDAHGALRAGEMERLRERHYFHWRHRRILVPLGALAAGAAAWLIFAFMPAAARERDSVLAAASFAYFARVHSGRRSRQFLSALLTKELLVGTLFTIGCALPVLGALHANHASLWPFVCAPAFFALLAWLNCHAIDRWESRRVGRTGASLARSASLLALCGLVAAVTTTFTHPRVALLLAAGVVSTMLLALLDRKRSQLSPVTLRAAADLVLLAPAPLLALAWLIR